LLFDYYKNPPAAELADMHYQESTLDKETVLKIAQKERVSLVISGCVDQANVTACYVAEQLRLPAPYSYETALRVTDKALMKAGMKRAGVPTADFKVIKSTEVNSFKSDKYPVVVKPCDSNGSKGVRKVDSADDLKYVLKQACDLSRSSKAIVEGFNEGIEINGYYYVSSGQPIEIYIKEKYKPSGADYFALQSFVSMGPSDISKGARDSLQKAVKLISKEFMLDNTPILVQANINNDNIKIIEFAPRVGGGLAFKEIQILTRFDIIDSVISSYLGEIVDISNIRKPEENVSVVHLYANGGKLSHVEGLAELVADDVVTDYYMHKTQGMVLGGDDLASCNRVLGAIICGSSKDEIQKKIRQMIDRVKIVSTDGVDVLNRIVFNSIE
jgi:biotin carboxylase